MLVQKTSVQSCNQILETVDRKGCFCMHVLKSHTAATRVLERIFLRSPCRRSASFRVLAMLGSRCRNDNVVDVHIRAVFLKELIQLLVWHLPSSVQPLFWRRNFPRGRLYRKWYCRTMMYKEYIIFVCKIPGWSPFCCRDSVMSKV